MVSQKSLNRSNVVTGFQKMSGKASGEACDRLRVSLFRPAGLPASSLFELGIHEGEAGAEFHRFDRCAGWTREGPGHPHCFGAIGRLPRLPEDTAV